MMQIIFKCDCGNEVAIPAPAGKYTQLRDYLETKQFQLGDVVVENNILKELNIKCKKCKKQITLGI